MIEYKASFDTLTKIITITVAIIFLSITLKTVNQLSTSQNNLKTLFIPAGILIFVIATLVGSYLLSIQKYIVEDSTLVIKRAFGDKRISIADIEEVRLIAKDEMRGTIRTFGNGGFFGYYGKYYNKKLGSFTLYSTQRKNRIFIRTKHGDKLVISPDDISLADVLKAKR
jgi:hypothetical protein